MTSHRRLADAAVVIGLSIVVIGGTYNTFMAYRQSRAAGQMMGGMMRGMIIGPFWYIIGTIIVVVGVGGVYLLIREKLTEAPAAANRTSPENTEIENNVSSEETPNPLS